MRIRPARNKSRKESFQAERVTDTEADIQLPTSLQRSLCLLQETWSHCDDFRGQPVVIQGVSAAVVFVRGLVNVDLLETGIMAPLTQYADKKVSTENLITALTAIPVRTENRLSTINQAIADGSVIVLVDGQSQSLVADVSKFPGRSIEPSQVEPSIQGPQEAFVENLETNLALIRKRLRTPRLKAQAMRIGQVTRTTVVIVYIDGIANPKIIDEVQSRLHRIDIDGILDTSFIREMIADHPYSPFRTSEVTERSDRAAAGLLQGRVIILVDGAPTVIAVPVVFIGALASAEDYYNNYIVAFQVRILRHLTYWASLLLPSLYIALLSYNPDLIPTPLLISLAAQHEGIPFPTVVEALVMQAAFEALREAGVRLPKAVGQSVSIVGALVIGDAAVNANLVSPGMVIVVAAAGVASFTIPSQDLSNTNRLLQFPFMLSASLLGLYGVVTLGLALVIHMVSLRSFGVPYMAPIAPFSGGEMRDTFIRAPWWAMSRRPTFYEPIDIQRNRTPVPGPKTGGDRA